MRAHYWPLRATTGRLETQALRLRYTAASSCGWQRRPTVAAGGGGIVVVERRGFLRWCKRRRRWGGAGERKSRLEAAAQMPGTVGMTATQEKLRP